MHISLALETGKVQHKVQAVALQSEIVDELYLQVGSGLRFAGVNVPLRCDKLYLQHGFRLEIACDGHASSAIPLRCSKYPTEARRDLLRND